MKEARQRALVINYKILRNRILFVLHGLSVICLVTFESKQVGEDISS